MMDKAVAEVTSDKDTTSTELNAVLKDAYIEPPEDKDDTGDKSDVPPGSQVWLGQLLAHWTNALTLDGFVKRADAVGEYWCTLDSPQSKSLQTLELGVGELKFGEFNLEVSSPIRSASGPPDQCIDRGISGCNSGLILLLI